MSTTPNSWLGNLYGTAPTETEKFASAEAAHEADLWNLFKAAAAEDGIDADALNDEQVSELSQHYINESEAGEAEEDNNELPPNWDGDDVDHFNSLEGEQEKQAFVQFKEADLVGKIMAHSMFSEMDKLAAQKEAMGYAGGMEGMKTDAKDLYSAAKPHLTGANALKATGAAATGLVGAKAVHAVGKRLLGKRKPAPAQAEKAAMSQKVAEIIEAEAVERARNFLKEAGIDPDSGEEYADEQEQDFDLSEITEDDASEIADGRAMEILKEAGWIQ